MHPRYVENPNANFTFNDIYKPSPELKTHSDYINFFKEFPNISHPGVFGFHANADITKDIGEVNLLYDNLILCSGSTKSGGGG
jgi:dynein heavy chain